jgi:hypothetical protein
VFGFVVVEKVEAAVRALAANGAAARVNDLPLIDAVVRLQGRLVAVRILADRDAGSPTATNNGA